MALAAAADVFYDKVQSLQRHAQRLRDTCWHHQLSLLQGLVSCCRDLFADTEKIVTIGQIVDRPQRIRVRVDEITDLAAVLSRPVRDDRQQGFGACRGADRRTQGGAVVTGEGPRPAEPPLSPRTDDAPKPGGSTVELSRMFGGRVEVGPALVALGGVAVLTVFLTFPVLVDGVGGSRTGLQLAISFGWLGFLGLFWLVPVAAVILVVLGLWPASVSSLRRRGGRSVSSS